MSQLIRSFSPTSKQIALTYDLGNHSYSHPNFTKLAPEEMINELITTEKILQDLGEIDPKPLFRPPYGAFNKK